MSEAELKRIEALEAAVMELNPGIVLGEPVQRICGLTMEEWDVVIDGKYLCECKHEEHYGWSPFKLIIHEIYDKDKAFRMGNGVPHTFCRPYRAVGHVQPYFDNAECKAYLDGLNTNALIIRHYTIWAGWKEVISLHAIQSWVDCDKFIVLQND